MISIPFIYNYIIHVFAYIFTVSLTWNSKIMCRQTVRIHKVKIKQILCTLKLSTLSLDLHLVFWLFIYTRLVWSKGTKLYKSLRCKSKPNWINFGRSQVARVQSSRDTLYLGLQKFRNESQTNSRDDYYSPCHRFQLANVYSAMYICMIYGLKLSAKYS